MIKHIKSFHFNYAQYRLSDGRDSAVLLDIDYASNKYQLRDVGKQIDTSFNAEIRQVAENLLSRKRGVHFVSRLDTPS